MRLNRLPRVKLAHLPTPLYELRRLSEVLGGPRIFVKRDDLTGLALGGNKTRKLEFLMGVALAEKADYVVTGVAFFGQSMPTFFFALLMIMLFSIAFKNWGLPYLPSGNALAPKGYLTGAEWNWSTPYTTHVKEAMAGRPMNNFMRGGLKDGFVKAGAYGSAVGDPARKSADAVKAQMMKGDFVIFKGPLKDNTGKTVIAAGTVHKQTDVVLEQMNYLVEGVIGKV